MCLLTPQGVHHLCCEVLRAVSAVREPVHLPVDAPPPQPVARLRDRGRRVGEEGAEEELSEGPGPESDPDENQQGDYLKHFTCHLSSPSKLRPRHLVKNMYKSLLPIDQF